MRVTGVTGATAALVAVLACGCTTTAGARSDSSSPAGPGNPQASFAACRTFARTLPGHLHVVSAGAETAGDVVRTDREQPGHGQAVHPWDQLPSDHRVYACGVAAADASALAWYVIDSEGRHAKDAGGGLVNTR